MACQLTDLNAALERDPAGFMARCDQDYQEKIARSADAIEKNLPQSPVVLLAGPSGSGKTTTAMKIEEELERRGFLTRTVSMDHYYSERPPGTELPKTRQGDLDLESPDLLDWRLLGEHFTKLERHETIVIPHFDFATQTRNPQKAEVVTPREREVVIFEGIHALNPRITDPHPGAFRLHIAASTDVKAGEEMVFKRTWLRLCRRSVRDYKFRGYGVSDTLKSWANVRRGEKKYITPYKSSAHIRFDSALAYEPGVMAVYATPILATVPEDDPNYGLIRQVMDALGRFVPTDPALVPANSLLREFIGGSSYHY